MYPGQLSLKVYWSQNLVWYSWIFEISRALFLLKTIQKHSVTLPKFLLIFVLCLSLLCNIVFSAPLFTYIFYHSFSPHLYIGMLFLFSFYCLVYLLYLMLLWCILLLFFYYMWSIFNSKLIYASKNAGWAVNPYGLSPILHDSKMSREHEFAKPEVFHIFIFLSACN